MTKARPAPPPAPLDPPRLVRGEQELVDPNTLVPHPRNPRRGNVGRILALFRKHGFYGLVQAQRSTRYVLVGNHRVLAARLAGMPVVPVEWLDVDDTEALQILTGDNRPGDEATYERDLLAGLLADLAEEDALDGSGYSAHDLEVLLDNLGATAGRTPAGRTDPDAVGDLPEEPRCAAGEVYLLGEGHRLVVGDSRDPAALELALPGRLADAVWTDPPYGVDYEGSRVQAIASGERRGIAGDLPDGLRPLLESVLGNALRKTRPGGAWWVAAPAGPRLADFAAVLAPLEVWRQTVVWVKDRFVLGRQDYHYRHELLLAGAAPETVEGLSSLDEALLIAQGWKPGAAHHAPRGRKADTVWEVPRPTASAVHPTMKPVALIERGLRDSTDPGAVVLDPFAGSGSTLIACFRAGRVGALVENDRRYADVILARWQAFTGVPPVLEASGAPVNYGPAPA